MKKPLLIALALITMLAAALAATQLKSEKTYYWKSELGNTGFWVGRFYGLETYLKAMRPTNAPQRIDSFADFQKEARSRNAIAFMAHAGVRRPEHAQAILDWVARGNTLVMAPVFAPDQEGAPEDSLQKRLGVRLEEAKLPDSAQDAAVTPDPVCVAAEEDRQHARRQVRNSPIILADLTQHAVAHCSRLVSSVRLPEGKTLNLIALHPWVLSAPPAKALWAAKNSLGPTAFRVPYGQGGVVVVNDMSLWDTPAEPPVSYADLSQMDNAYLALYLTQDKSKILLINRLKDEDSGSSGPLWWRWLQRAPWVMGLLIVWTALFVWRQSVRLGPLREEDTRQERSFARALNAYGYFEYRHHRADVLRALQADLYARWQQRIPSFSALPFDKRLAAIMALGQVSQEDAQLWMRPVPAKISFGQWLGYLQAHQRLRKNS